MRYSVKTLKSGEYAVDAGRGQHFTSTVTTDRKEAERQAVIMTLWWHREMMEKAWSRAQKHGIFDEDEDMYNFMA